MLRFELERVTNVITIVIDQHFFAYTNLNGFHNAIIPFNGVIKATNMDYFFRIIREYNQTFFSMLNLSLPI